MKTFKEFLDEQSNDPKKPKDGKEIKNKEKVETRPDHKVFGENVDLDQHNDD